ncbi:MAG: Nif3-like dinuclear metal center hexameric protein [Bacteroidetes bacterium]|nr:Nif3-like dinuclear metal center hexameric protein [Bacteroidota bacterium]
MLLSEILNYLEGQMPFALQEDYDNSGLIIGNASKEVKSALICLDITEEIMKESISRNCDLIISHHPLVFKGIKRFTGKNITERLVEEAIRNNISIIALHTNIDNHPLGVNSILCRKLGIMNPRILRPMGGLLKKLATFVPASHADKVRTSLFEAGAGTIGNYDSCSFNIAGRGTFRALEGSSPFVGEQGKLHVEQEEKIEVIYSAFLEKKILSALLSSHPYEEVAYDIYQLANKMPYAGAGMIGELDAAQEPLDYLAFVKATLSLGSLRHTELPNKKIKKIAVCGGSGSFLIADAIAAGADLFLTGDIKYHDFFLPEKQMLLADVGHYESEQFSKELIFTLLNKKFPTFALLISKTPTNPVNYL